MATPTGILFSDPRVKPLSTTGQFQSGCYLCFFATGTTTPQNVFSDGMLTTPLSQPAPGSVNPAAGTVSAADGRFVPIYLSPTVIYRVQMYSAAGILLEDTDPYVPTLNQTQSNIAAVLFPQTPAENAAGVTPTLFNIARYKDVPLERYGVVVGGSTSLAAANTAAIQNAINVAAAISNTGGVIIVPQGTIYVQANSLTMGTNAVNWLGEGKGQAFLKAIGAASDQAILSFFGTSGTPIDSIFVRGIAFASDNNLARGITAQWVKNSAWDDLYFYQLLNGWVGSTCFGSGFRNNNAYGITNDTYILTSLANAGGCSNSVFDKCRMVGVNGVAVNFATDSLLFDGCDFEGIISNGAAIALTPPTGSIVSAVKIIGSHFENINGTAIFAVGTDANSIAGLTVKGCFIKGGFGDSGNANAKNAIQLGKVNGYDISDNNFVDWGTDDATGGGTQGYAIYTVGAASNAVNGNIERNRSAQSTVGGAVIRTVQNVCDVTPDSSNRITNNWAPANGTGFKGYQRAFQNPAEVPIAVANGGTATCDANTGSIFVITASGAGFTLANPPNMVIGKPIKIRIKNTSGGALAITYGGLIKQNFTAPATGNNRTLELDYDGTNFNHIGGTFADVPN